jgi:iron complex outermembrane receptor protein
MPAVKMRMNVFNPEKYGVNKKSKIGLRLMQSWHIFRHEINFLIKKIVAFHFRRLTMTHARALLPFQPLVVAVSAVLACWPAASDAQQQNEQAGGGIQEVIVTAQKRRERASEVPSAISVVGQAQLENQHVSQLSDLTGSLPSVQIVDGGTPGQTQISVRGIPTLGPGAVVGTYLDDTPLGSSSNFSQASVYVLDLLPYDVARIELLRGPQGTLYGASAMGGLLKYVTNDPDLQALSGRVGGGFSHVKGAHASGWEARSVVNVPVIKDVLALRATVANTVTPGYIDNVLLDQRDANRVQQQYGRLAMLWKAGERVTVKLSGLRQKIDADDNSTIRLDPLTRAPAFGAGATGKLVAEPFAKTVDYFSATVAVDLQWADLLAASSYSKTTTQQVTDLSPQFGVAFPDLVGAPAGISAFPLDLHLRKFTQELRLSSKSGGTVEWLLNAFYTKERSRNGQAASALALDGTPVAGLDPIYTVDLPSTYEEKAVYGQLTYKLTERFDVTGGLRYARNNQAYLQNVSAGILSPIGVSNGSSRENVTTYLASARYRLAPDRMLYARVASGYRPGGPNLVLPGVPATVSADKLVNYEVGMKSLFLDKRASVELAAYQIDWKDIQLTALSSSGLNYLANAGTAKSRGLELSTNLRATPAWRIGFNAAWTHARLTEDAPSVAGRDGDTIQGIPDWTASLTSDYSFDAVDGWTPHVGGGYNWTGKRNSGQSSDPQSYRLASYGLLHLNADIANGPWTVRAYAKNLANNRANTMLTNIPNAVTGEVVTLLATRPQPRTVGIEVDFAF